MNDLPDSSGAHLSYPPDAGIPACSPACLLRRRNTFVTVRPIRAGSGFLYQTDAGTLIKRKKHYGTKPQTLRALYFPFRQERQNVAFSLLRTQRPQGVIIPERECACSYEMCFINGEMLCARSSPYFAGLNTRFGARGFKDRKEALYFVREAGASLLRLHHLGIMHGDPGCNNLLLTSEGVHLIDIDDAVYLGPGMQDWEYQRFLRRTVAPILSEYYSTRERLHFYCEHGLSTKLVVNALITRVILAGDSCRFAIAAAVHQASFGK
jgi:hypothetical protein